MWNFLYRQLFVTPPPLSADVDLRGKTILITGGTTGLGFESCRQLVEHGVTRLILPVRSRQRGETAKQALSAVAAKNKTTTRIDLYDMDQESYESVLAFVENLKNDGVGHLDVAILNAGIQSFHHKTAPNGTEQCLQVNYLSAALLALALLALLRAGDESERPGRLSIVGSETHYWAPLKERSAKSILTAIDQVPAKNFSGDNQYYNSKLLSALFGRELASRLNPKSIVLNQITPGLCRSSIGRDMTWGFRLFNLLVDWTVARSAAVGARTITHAAVVAGDDSHGQFLCDCAPLP